MDNTVQNVPLNNKSGDLDKTSRKGLITYSVDTMKAMANRRKNPNIGLKVKPAKQEVSEDSNKAAKCEIADIHDRITAKAGANRTA